MLRFRKSVWGMLVLAGMLWGPAISGQIAVADAGRPPIVSYRLAPHAVLASSFVQQVKSLPEWAPFASTLSEAVLAALDKELSPSRLELFLSPETTKSVRETISRSDAIVGAITKGATHVHGLGVHVQVSPHHNRIDTMVAVLLDVNPRAALVGLSALREGKDYEYIINNANDFVVKFHLTYQGRAIDFGCAGVKLPGDARYAVVLAGCDDIIARYEAFRDGECTILDTDGPAHELILDEAVFGFLAQQEPVRKIGLGELLTKVARLRATTAEVDGKAQVHAELTLKSADDATTVRDLLAGMIALLQMMQNETTPEIAEAVAFLSTTKLDVRDATVLVKLTLDHPALWKLIGRGLREATREIEKRDPLRVGL